MKRITLAAAAALMVAGPLAAPAAAQSYGQSNDRDGDWRGDRGDRDDDGRWRHGDDDDRGDRYDRNDRRGDRRDARNHRRHERWDNRRHNGYSYNGRWNYGPPPAAYYEGRNGYEVGYRSWRRGDRLPSYYQSRYRTVDYRRAHLRAPPRGYRYVQDDRGDMLLVGIATGVILGIILSNQ